MPRSVSGGERLDRSEQGGDPEGTTRPSEVESAPQPAAPPRRRRWGRVLVTAVVIFVGYVLLGATLPFAWPPQMTDAERAALPPAASFVEPDGAGDRAGIIEDNLGALDTRLQLFRTAQREIVLTTFDFKADNSGRDVLAGLLEAADRGVRVRVLVDGLTSLAHMRGAPEFYAVAAHEGVEIRLYNTPSLIRPWSINGRYHDKIVVVDGALLLLGGRNTYDFFLGDYDTPSPSLDREALVYNAEGAASGAAPEGSAIRQALDYVEGVWGSADVGTGFEEPADGVDATEMATAADGLRRLATDNVGRFPPRHDPDDWLARTMDVDNVSLVTNPTHTMSKVPVIWEVQLQLMHAADAQVVVQTPYYVASNDMDADLAEVARGRQVVLAVNSAATGDNVVASGDYLYHRDELLATGVAVTEYFGDDSAHAKSLVVDDRISVVGSYNFDLRSVHLSTESVLVVAGEEFNADLREKFAAFAPDAVPVNPDGTYQTTTGEPPVPLEGGQWWFLHILGLAMQPIRYLI